MKALAAVLCILVLGLAAGCAAPGPETYGGNQEKQPRSYPPEMLRLLPL